MMMMNTIIIIIVIAPRRAHARRQSSNSHCGITSNAKGGVIFASCALKMGCRPEEEMIVRKKNVFPADRRVAVRFVSSFFLTFLRLF